MQKFNLSKIKSFLFRKKVLIPVGILVVLFFFVFFKHENGESLSITTPVSGAFAQTVRATGVVTSNTDLDLSFGKQGTVQSIKVEVGDKVRAGEVLASLDARSDYAEVTKAKGALAQAEAKLQKTIEGVSNEEITLAQVSLDNARKDYENTKNTQDVLVKNAYNNLLNSTPEAVPSESISTNATAPTISGTYVLNQEGSINISVYNSGSGTAFSVSGLVSGGGYVNSTTPQPIGNSGLYILFSASSNLSGTSWVINLPNKKASDYLTNKNAYESALKTRDGAVSSALSLVAQREAELAVKQAKARDSDVALAQAEVLAAEGGLEKAQAIYADNIIKAPADGTITEVNIKYGELADSNKKAIVLEDVDNLYVEALINESNIASIVLGQRVEVTFDALTDQEFTGVVSHVDPSALTEDGVVNYKIKVSLNEESPFIRPGMNAEIAVIAFEKEDALAVPRTFVFEKDGKKFVNVLLNKEEKTFKETEVTVGQKGDGNMIEILSGISAADKLVLLSQ